MENEAVRSDHTFTRRSLCAALMLLALPASAGGTRAAPDEQLARRLDLFLREQVDKGFTGAVLVARGNDVLLSRGYGYANLEWRIPNTPQTRFRIASLTKSFTATAIMQLREKQALSLSDSICRYVEPCPPDWKAVTIQQLLTNSSGIPNHFWGTEPDRQRVMSQAQVLALIASRPLEFAPGTQFNYGNAGWYLLGLVIEKVTRKSYDQALRELIFQPLGMRDTGQDSREAVIERRASGYLVVDAKPSNVLSEDVSWVIAAASLYSTVEDLYRFDRALNGPTLLPQSALNAMWAPVNLSMFDAPHQKAPYGFGWWLRPKEDPSPHRLIRGMGGMAGFMSTLCRFPDDELTLIVLENSIGLPPIEPKLESMLFERSE